MNKLTRATSISLVSLIIGLGGGIFMSSYAQDEGKVFELRIYKSTPGNLDNLHSRFHDHTIRIFGKHDMEVIGFWSPTDEEESNDTLIYMLEHKSQKAAIASWDAFGQDPEWTEVSKTSNANGRILANVESRFMTATDYSPMQ